MYQMSDVHSVGSNPRLTVSFNQNMWQNKEQEQTNSSSSSHTDTHTQKTKKSIEEPTDLRVTNIARTINQIDNTE